MELIDLAAERLGGEVLWATDDFFAPKENLLKPAKAIWIEDKYTDRGKWMDGWESRRRRTPGHDWCIIRLGLPGVLRHITVDTAFFKGNYPEQCSLQGCTGEPPQGDDGWIDILPRSPLQGDSENHFSIDSPYRCTHLRFHIFPDGGVARLRVYGDGIPAWMEPGHLPEELDLAAVANGARVVACSDMFFGSRHNLIMPGHATHMGDGWETRRRRGPGNDWVVVALGTHGEVESIDFDTSHFKGNAPGEASIEVCLADGDGELRNWKEILPCTKVFPDRLHRFHRQLHAVGEVSHVRVNVFPDGGVARLRVYGTVSAIGRQIAGLRWFNAQRPDKAAEDLRRCCGSPRWIEAMMAGRPYSTPSAFFEAADKAWWALEVSDWQAAFACHPAIGARADSGHQDIRGEGWSKQEQAGTSGDSNDTQQGLADGNVAYRNRFGYTYIVCASGRSGEEMLGDLQRRLNNTTDHEAKVAAGEQNKITLLRLERLLKG